MNSQQIMETCERIISNLIRDFLVNGDIEEETTNLVFETIQTLDNLRGTVQESECIN